MTHAKITPEKMFEMRKSGLTLKEIAEHAGLTRQRIDQILRHYYPEVVVQARTRRLEKISRKLQEERKCRKCPRMIRMEEGKKHFRKICTYCPRGSKYSTREEAYEAVLQRNRERYKDPEYRKIHAILVEKNRIRRREAARTDPVLKAKLADIQKRAAQRWKEKKLRSNPNYFREQSAKQWAARQEAQRLYDLKRIDEFFKNTE